MTVCIAAISEDSHIVGASDRMISSGDIAFEPERSKVFSISNSIVVMYSGDSGIARHLYNKVYAIAVSRILADPSNWWSVEDIALLWSESYRRETVRQATDAVLSPLGLDLESFIARQREMTPELVTRLALSLQNHRIPFVSAIVAGIDPSGPHIYVVSEAQVLCKDQAGFASIGGGNWHASSQFMFAAHASHRPLAQTTWLTYLAKKHAEVAPGVGEATDMFAILGLGGLVQFGPPELQKLETVYKENRRRALKVAQSAQLKIAEYFNSLPESTPEQQAGDAKDNSEGICLPRLRVFCSEAMASVARI